MLMVSEQGLIPGLPDCVAEYCLLHISRTDLVSARQVSKAWHELLQDEKFFHSRKELGVAEEWLYMCRQDKGRRAWYSLNPQKRQWKQLPAIPVDNEHGSLQAVSVGVAGVDYVGLYMIGGFDGATGRLLRHVSKFHWKIGQWQRLDCSMVTPRADFGLAVIGRHIFVAGGFDEHNVNLESAEVFDAAMNEWSPTPALPKGPMHWLDTAVVGASFYLKQRQEFVAPLAATPVGIFDSARQVWRADAEMSKGWVGPSAVVGGQLYVVGNLLTIRRYSALTGQWEPVSGTFAYGVRVKRAIGLGDRLYAVCDSLDRGITRMYEISFSSPTSASVSDNVISLPGQGKVTDVVVMAL